MESQDFLEMLHSCRLIDHTLTKKKIAVLFTHIQQLDVASGEGDNNELVYEEFLEVT